MITVTEKAQQELNAYFEGKEVGAIRVHLAQGGCSGPRLMLALDEANANDEVFVQNNYTYCIEKELLQQAKSVTIDFTYMGFSVESEVSFGGGGCGSGGCSGCAH